MYYDVVGSVLAHIEHDLELQSKKHSKHSKHPVNTDDESYIINNLDIDNVTLKDYLTPDEKGDGTGELYYDGFGFGGGHRFLFMGPAVYIVFLSAIFMGTIVLEGVDTSIMAKVTPPKLNACFFNSGLLATLVGTLGRVFADGMITMSALLDVHVFVDFVNATMVPLLLLAFLGLLLVNRYYEKLVV